MFKNRSANLGLSVEPEIQYLLQCEPKLKACLLHKSNPVDSICLSLENTALLVPACNQTDQETICREGLDGEGIELGRDLRGRV